MKHSMLLPHSFKKIGWFLLVPAALFAIISIITGTEMEGIKSTVFAISSDSVFGKSQNFSFIQTDILSTLVGVLCITGGLMVGFSREKHEDEYIAQLRLNSLLWAVLVNYLLLLFMFLFIYGFGFLNVMMYNMFTTLIIFIAKFNLSLFRNSKTASIEE